MQAQGTQLNQEVDSEVQKWEGVAFWPFALPIVWCLENSMGILALLHYNLYLFTLELCKAVVLCDNTATSAGAFSAQDTAKKWAQIKENPLLLFH